MSRPTYRCARCRRPATSRDDRPWRDVDGKLVCGGCVADRELTAPAVDPTVSPIEQYLAAVEAGLPLGGRKRRRVLAEVGQHLDEAAGGRGDWQAERAAVRAFGPAESLIAEYGPRRSPSPVRRQARRVAVGIGLVAVAGLSALATRAVLHPAPPPIAGPAPPGPKVIIVPGHGAGHHKGRHAQRLHRSSGSKPQTTAAPTTATPNGSTNPPHRSSAPKHHHRSSKPSPPKPTPPPPTTGFITTSPAAPATVSLQNGQLAPCTTLAVSVSELAPVVTLYIYGPTGDLVRTTVHHNNWPNQELSFPAWCGKAQAPLVPGQYTWWYTAQWTANGPLSKSAVGTIDIESS